MTHRVIEALNWRYACKKYNPAKKLNEEQLNTILEALRLTASSYGMQPWEFVVVRNEELREKMVGASYNQSQVKNASHLIVLCRKEDVGEAHVDAYLEDIAKTRGVEMDSLAGFKKMMMLTASKPTEQKIHWMKDQVYIALGNLLTVCALLGVDATPMEGFSPSKVDDILDLKSMGLKSVLLCPIGFRADDDSYSQIKKVRFPKEKVVKYID